MENNTFPLHGRKARIINNTSNHQFLTGQIVVLDYSETTNNILTGKLMNGDDWFFLNDEDYELIPDATNYQQEFHKIAEKHCEHVIKLIQDGKLSFCRFTLMDMLCNAGEEFIKEFVQKID